MTRSPLFLAALASSAVPGLDPVSVEGVRRQAGDLFEVAYVQDSQDRRWVIKAPLSQGAGAMLEDVTALGSLLGRRLDVAVPMVRGQVDVPEGRAVVYLRVPGRQLDFAVLPHGDLAAAVGRTLAHIHNIEHVLYEEAGRPTYDAESHRRRQLSELDRAAATGHVPTQLLTRWEALLEDVSLWRFAPTAVHGTFVGANVLASFDDEEDAAGGHVRGVLAWEESRIGDPADDFADLVARAEPQTLEDVLEAYRQSRVERPDPHLPTRARLSAEMSAMTFLLRALAAGDRPVIDAAAAALRDLDARTYDEPLTASPAAAASSLEAASAERPAESVDWDATQPHVVFPTSGETQSLRLAPDTPEPPASGDLSDPGDTPDAPEPSDAPTPPDVPEPPESTGAEHEEPPTTSSIADFFEVDEVEALPEDQSGVLDLHEGASSFVPVPPRQPPTEN